MKKFLIICLALSLIAGCLFGCGTEPAITQPVESAPAETEAQDTQPTETAPQPTKPVQATVPAAGAIIDNLTCTITVGKGSPKTIENPTASHFYQYVKEARSGAVQKDPPFDNANVESSVLHISFQLNGKEVRRLDIYEDDYASIPLSLEYEAAKFYEFPSGTYQTICNSIK